MFEYVKGRLTRAEADAVIIETGGFGFKIFVSRNTIAGLPAEQGETMMLLHPVYREDDITLYGFATSDERDLFRTLIAISGIGPKVAMGILSQFAGDELIRHILNGDAKAIAKAPGIGKKTAERIVLELKDKFKGYAPAETDVVEGGGAVENMRLQDNIFNEAVNGLMGLGFPYAQAAGLVEKVILPDLPIEMVLQLALQAAAN